MLESKVNKKEAYKIVTHDGLKFLSEIGKNYGDLIAIGTLNLLEPTLNDLAISIDSNITARGSHNFNLIEDFHQHYQVMKPFIMHYTAQAVGIGSEVIASYKNARENHGKVNASLRAIEAGSYRFFRNLVVNASFGEDYSYDQKWPNTAQLVITGVSDGLRYGKPFSRLGSTIAKGFKKLTKRE
ncbi:hypothetical protein CL622_08405 [archaeon]|nr:hypothetical protein [archaeon]|tara:strand:+ start:568 stop:1119 length:552 start_codon:yes stop_codon:yes gene_type:complete